MGCLKRIHCVFRLNTYTYLKNIHNKNIITNTIYCKLRLEEHVIVHLICDIKIFVDIFLYLIERGRFCRAYHSNPILCIYRCKFLPFIEHSELNPDSFLGTIRTLSRNNANRVTQPFI